ncbi:MAG: alpha-galactosidase, partial [Blautia sp.]|nr:alpha-galactosidase [Blautia sp.]
MFIRFHEKTRTFHLQNDQISYVMCVLSDGTLTQLYFGEKIHDREDAGYLLEGAVRSHSAYMPDCGAGISLEHIKLEYPSYGTGDYRQGALEILQENGSRASHFVYRSHTVTPGKPALEGLPATYTENEEEAGTLCIFMEDPVNGTALELNYTLFTHEAAIARSARIINKGKSPVQITRAMSLCLDLPESSYDWMQFSGSWARERYPVIRRLAPGTTQIESLRGHSSHQQNPFVILKRPDTDEEKGEALGISLIYSGNFQISAQVDPYHVTRILAGINPIWFSWKLEEGEAFQTPEALLAWSGQGLNGLSRIYHTLYRERLARGVWRDRERPVLINNWEATYFDFNEEKLLKIAKKARDCGVELFVLDDGWFGARRSDNAGLGDWVAARELLPDGIGGLSEKVEALGLKFGLWIEPEMVNPDSDLYRKHPDWCLKVPGRVSSLGRNQLVLDFSRTEVVDFIYGMLYEVFSNAKISYVKWDMNRSITECYSEAYPAQQQGEIFHRYILGVYDLYERLLQSFPGILFESCAGGGGLFDPGMLYYAPQAWTSDDTDAMERIKIQYGTSYGYPLVSMGSHVSAVPNHQVGRITPL